MVPARLRIDLRRASELAHPDNGRRLEHSAILQVGHQRSPRRIEHSQQTFDRFEIVLVRVPGESLIIANTIQRHFNKWNAPLDQSPGQHARLTELISTVRIAQCCVFIFEVECLDRF